MNQFVPSTKMEAAEAAVVEAVATSAQHEPQLGCTSRFFADLPRLLAHYRYDPLICEEDLDALIMALEEAQEEQADLAVTAKPAVNRQEIAQAFMAGLIYAQHYDWIEQRFSTVV